MQRKTWARRLKSVVRQRTIATRSAVMAGRASARLVELNQRRASSQDRTPVNAENLINPDIEINSAPSGIHRIDDTALQARSPVQTQSRPHTPSNLSPQVIQGQDTPLGESVHHQLVGFQTNTLTDALDCIENEIAGFEKITDRERNWTTQFKTQYKALNEKLEAKKTLCKQKGLQIILTRIYTLSSRLDSHFNVLQSRSKHCSTIHNNGVPQATGGLNETPLDNTEQTEDPDRIDRASMNSSLPPERLSVQALVHRINSANNSPVSRNMGLGILEPAQVEQGNFGADHLLATGGRISSATDFEILDHVSEDADDAQGDECPPPYEAFEIDFVVSQLIDSAYFKSEISKLVINATDSKFEHHKTLINDCDESIKTLDELRIKNRTVNSIREDLSKATKGITNLSKDSTFQKKRLENFSTLIGGLISDLGKLEAEFKAFKATAAREKQTLSTEVTKLSRQVKNLDSYIKSHRCIEHQEPLQSSDNVGVRFSQDARNRTDEQPRTPVQVQIHRVNVSQPGTGLPLLERRDTSSGRRQGTPPNRHTSPQPRRTEQSVLGGFGQSRQEIYQRHRSVSPDPNTSFGSPPVGRSSRQSSHSSTSNADKRAVERLEIRITQYDDELNNLVNNYPTGACSTKNEITQLKNTVKPSVEELRGELSKLREKYEQLPSPSYDTLLSIDTTLTATREWLASFRERFQALDGFSNPLSGKSLLDVGVFTENSDISIFEFIRKFEFAQCSGQGTKSEKATLLFEKHLEEQIKDKFFDLRDDYDSLVLSLKQVYGIPTMMCKNIMKNVTGDPPGINASLSSVADYMRILECACKKLDSLFNTPGIDRQTLKDEAYGNSFVKNLMDRVPAIKADEVYDLIEDANENINYLHGEKTYQIIRDWIKRYANKTNAKAKNSSCTSSTATVKPRGRSTQLSANVATADSGDHQSHETRDQSKSRLKGPGNGASNDKTRNRSQNKTHEKEKSKVEEDLTRLCPLRTKDHPKSPHSVLNCKEFLELIPAKKRSAAYGKMCYTCFGDYKICKPGCVGNVPEDILCHDCARAYPDSRVPNIIMCPDITHREKRCDEDSCRALSAYFPSMQFKVNEAALLGSL